MKMTYEYNIQDFTWNKEKNTLYGTAWDLIPNEPYEGTDPFPNGKEQFTIRNYKTYGFRRFRFVEERVTTVKLEESLSYTYIDDQYMGGPIDHYHQTDWVFESEDGIKCVIDVGMHY